MNILLIAYIITVKMNLGKYCFTLLAKNDKMMWKGVGCIYGMHLHIKDERISNYRDIRKGD